MPDAAAFPHALPHDLTHLFMIDAQRRRTAVAGLGQEIADHIGRIARRLGVRQRQKPAIFRIGDAAAAGASPGPPVESGQPGQSYDPREPPLGVRNRKGSKNGCQGKGSGTVKHGAQV